MSEHYTIRVLADGEVVNEQTFSTNHPNLAEAFYSRTVDNLRRLDAKRELTVQFINPDGSVEYDMTFPACGSPDCGTCEDLTD